MFFSYKTSKGKNKDFARQIKFFFNADTKADVNANSDAEMQMPRFPDGL